MRPLIVLCVLWFAAIPLLANGPAALSVVTYNIRYANPNDGLDVWPNRVDKVAAFLSDHDVVGLQEVTFAQLGDLRQRLSGFDWYGVGRDDGENGGEHAVVGFRKTRIEVVGRGTFWLSQNPDQVGVKGWDAALPRTCTWMVLLDNTSDQTFWVANTHFDHRGANARTESGKLIRSVVDQQSGEMPVIVMGDFNCLPDSDPYRALTSPASQDSSPLVDARSLSAIPPKGPTSTWNGFREIVPGRIIDHLFVRGPLEVLEVETLNPQTEAGRFASDHLPVRASVRISAVRTTSSE